MNEKSLTSVELMLSQYTQQLDNWAEQANSRDVNLFETVKNIVNNMRHTQTNMNEMITQISREIQEWEKISREEFLTRTTPIQNLFPIRSYEDINKQLNYFQKKITELPLKPLQNLSNINQIEGYLSSVEKFIELRRINRELYVENAKKAATIFLSNQTTFFKMASDQMQNAFFPFRRFMNTVSE